MRVIVEHAAEIGRDVRYGVWVLRQSPGFTTVAIASIALGITVGTCAFSEMNGIVPRFSFGVARPGELVALRTPTSYPNYRRYRELTNLSSSTLAYVAPVTLVSRKMSLNNSPDSHAR